MRARQKRVALGRGAAIAAVLALVSGATAVGTSAPSVATASGTTIDTTSLAAVTSAYKSIYLPAMTDTVGWTGSVDGCNAGTTSAQSQQYSLDIINFDRALAGLDPVTLDPQLNADAQQAALIMRANNNLSHSVPTSWTCYTDQGAAAAAASDLFLGEAGAQAIDGYMIDPGANNTEAGHRRWILYPPATTMGTGSTSSSNDLYIFGAWASSGDYTDPAWVSWPTSGYFPDPLEPNGRWSLGGSAEHNYDFSQATVSVRNSAGTALHVVVNKPANGFGADTLVWQVSGLKTPGDAPLSYSVSVKNIKEGGTTVAHSYVVKLFNPNSLATSGTPGISGFTRVGQVLTAAAPTFSPAATSLTYQWYRGSTAITGATHSIHTLVAKDLGAPLTVRVTGHRSGYGAMSATSSATAAIGHALTPTVSRTPVISGSVRVGQTLTVDEGAWNPGSGSVTYQWYRGSKAIARATAATRTLTTSDHGHTMKVRVTVHLAGYSSASRTLKTALVRNP
jgi:uncharacterized protein YkwD